MASLQLEAQHRAETGHLRTGEGVLRERFEAGIVNGPHGPVIFERLGEHLGTCALDLHADRERLQPASNQERLERAERRSHILYVNQIRSNRRRLAVMTAPATTSLCPPR